MISANGDQKGPADGANLPFLRVPTAGVAVFQSTHPRVNNVDLEFVPEWLPGNLYAASLFDTFYDTCMHRSDICDSCFVLLQPIFS
jgi:hypothetical protein